MLVIGAGVAIESSTLVEGIGTGIGTGVVIESSVFGCGLGTFGPRRFFLLQDKPIFCFNQSLPLLTVLTATFFVTVLTLSAMLSIIVLHGGLIEVSFVGDCGFTGLVLSFFGRVDFPGVFFLLFIRVDFPGVFIFLLFARVVVFTLLVFPKLVFLDGSFAATVFLSNLLTLLLCFIFPPILPIDFFLPLQKLLSPFFKH